MTEVFQTLLNTWDRIEENRGRFMHHFQGSVSTGLNHHRLTPIVPSDIELSRTSFIESSKEVANPENFMTEYGIRKKISIYIGHGLTYNWMDKKNF